MDWTASGIENGFEYELVDSVQLGVSYGFLDGVTSARITDSYRGDYRTTMRLDVDGSRLPPIAAVRVWHTARLGGESVRECLGTYFQSGGEDSEYRYGRETRSYSLYSALYRLDHDLRYGNAGIARGTGVVPHFKAIVSNAHGTPYVTPGFASSAKFGRARVWEAGDSVLRECNACANAVGGRIDVDAAGRVCLVPYQLPSEMEASFSIPSGDSSVTLVGVGESMPDVVNKVVAHYSSASGGKTRDYYAQASVAADHPWHWGKIGRNSVKDYNPPEMPKTASGSTIQRTLQAKVDARLRELSDPRGELSVSMLYMPIRVGHVGSFEYADSGGAGLRYDRVLLTEREINLDPTMKMSVTLEEM